MFVFLKAKFSIQYLTKVRNQVTLLDMFIQQQKTTAKSNLKKILSCTLLGLQF